MALRVVNPDETPKNSAKPPVTVSDAVARGTRMDELQTMRARIAKAIDEPNIRGADLAALSRRLLEIGKEIDAIRAAEAEESRSGDVSPDEAFDASAV